MFCQDGLVQFRYIYRLSYHYRGIDEDSLIITEEYIHRLSYLFKGIETVTGYYHYRGVYTDTDSHRGIYTYPNSRYHYKHRLSLSLQRYEYRHRLSYHYRGIDAYTDSLIITLVYTYRHRLLLLHRYKNRHRPSYHYRGIDTDTDSRRGINTDTDSHRVIDTLHRLQSNRYIHRLSKR